MGVELAMVEDHRQQHRSVMYDPRSYPCTIVFCLAAWA